MIILGLPVIPAVHLLAPLFIPDAPSYVATTASTSIMAKTNVYLQLLPFMLAYLSAPLLVILGMVRFFRNRKRQS